MRAGDGTFGCVACWFSLVATLGSLGLSVLCCLVFLVILLKISLNFVIARICLSPSSSYGASGSRPKSALVSASAACVALSNGDDCAVAQLWGKNSIVRTILSALVLGT